MTDSPIFDALAEERNYASLVEKIRYTVWPNIVNPGWEPAEPEEEETVETEQPEETKKLTAKVVTAPVYVANPEDYGFEVEAEDTVKFGVPGEWIAKPVPKMTPEYVKISENVEPETVEEKYGTFSGFVKELAKRFAEKYPYATDVMTSAARELDGSVTVSVSGQSGKGQWGGLTSQEAIQDLEDARQQFYAGSVNSRQMILDEPVLIRKLSEKQIESLATVTGIAGEADITLHLGE